LLIINNNNKLPGNPGSESFLSLRTRAFRLVELQQRSRSTTEQTFQTNPCSNPDAPLYISLPFALSIIQTIVAQFLELRKLPQRNFTSLRHTACGSQANRSSRRMSGALVPPRSGTMVPDKVPRKSMGGGFRSHSPSRSKGSSKVRESFPECLSWSLFSVHQDIVAFPCMSLSYRSCIHSCCLSGWSVAPDLKIICSAEQEFSWFGAAAEKLQYCEHQESHFGRRRWSC
jgi:hypothetical protein